MTDPAVAIAEALEAVVRPLRVQLDVTQRRLTKLERERRPTRLLTVAQMCEAHPALAQPPLRKWLAAAGRGSLRATGAVSRKGRRLYLDEARVLEWIQRRRK